MFPFAMVMAFVEFAAVIVSCEGCFYCAGAGEGVNGMVSRLGPEVFDQKVRISEIAGYFEFDSPGRVSLV